MSTEIMGLYYGNHRVRTLRVNNAVWWVAKDVCDALSISNSRAAVERLDEDEKLRGIALPDVHGIRRRMTLVNVFGIYSLIVRSDKPGAVAFRRWLTHEVLPQIQRTGSYRGLEGPTFSTTFVARYYANVDRVSLGYFSVIGELYVRLYGKLERLGYIVPDFGRTGQPVRPDVSIGQLFGKWLRKHYEHLSKSYRVYWHRLPDGTEVQARQYPNTMLHVFIEYIETVWIPQHAERYFTERDQEALPYFPRLLQLVTP